MELIDGWLLVECLLRVYGPLRSRSTRELWCAKRVVYSGRRLGHQTLLKRRLHRPLDKNLLGN
jgi:hypothetical protein